MNIDDITIRETTEDDWDGVGALFERVFGAKRDAKIWNWMIKESPESTGFSLVALDPTQQIVGHAASITRGFRIGGVRTLCGQSVDAMTHPDWQRKGINKKLNDALVLHNVKASIPYLMGFSNEHSTHTVLTHQGRRKIGQIPALVRPISIIRSAMHVARASASLPDAVAAQIPEDVDELWGSRGPSMRVGVDRDSSYLDWRYRKPGASYYGVELRQNGALQAFGVLGLRVQARLLTAFVMEAFVHNDDPKLWKGLVRALVRKARSLRCDTICALAFPGAKERKAFMKAGFIPIPDRVNPERIVVSLRATDGAVASQDVWEPGAWRISWGDTDLV